MTDSNSDYIDALVNLHRGLERKGPGDYGFAAKILSKLSELPIKPRIADLGCGSGASALQLAQHYQSSVVAVDSCLVFIEELQDRAKQLDLEDLIIPIHGDIGKPNWAVDLFDLLWSEGAAYNLGFERALMIWRSLLVERGIAVISEMSWFTDHVPEPAIAYWQNAYPLIGSEAENIGRANRAGFNVISTHRLPSHAWWTNYYHPLLERMQKVQHGQLTELVVNEITEEINLFKQFSEFYGYTFYILQAA